MKCSTYIVLLQSVAYVFVCLCWLHHLKFQPCFCCSLSPSTQNIIALVAEVKSLHTDKEHLRINLHRAEEEVCIGSLVVQFYVDLLLTKHFWCAQVKVLFEENNILDEENKRLMSKVHKEKQFSDSAGKHTSSGSAKVKIVAEINPPLWKSFYV